MSNNHAYVNARVRALKSMLLADADYQHLSQASDLDIFMQLLKDSSYAAPLEKQLFHHPGLRGIEDGLRNDLVKIYHKIVKMSEGQSKELLGLLLDRWDVADLKTILRGKHISTMPEEILSNIMQIGSLSTGLAKALAYSDDVKTAIELLLSTRNLYGRILASRLPAYLSSHSILELEYALDKAYFENTCEALARQKSSMDTALFSQVLTRDLLITNFLTVIKIFPETYDLDKKMNFIIIPKSAKSKNSLQTYEQLLRCPDLKALVAMAQARLKPKRIISRILAQAQKQGELTPTSLERAAEKVVFKENHSLFAKDPLTIAPVLAYLFTKLNEITNLRIIAYGVQAHLPKTTIRDALVLT